MSKYYVCPTCKETLRVVHSDAEKITGECPDCGVVELETSSIFEGSPGQISLFGGSR